MDQGFDVIIVGGGMVGASMACALDGAGLTVAVIETHIPDSAVQPSFDERTIALTWSSRQIFAGLGLWDAIRALHLAGMDDATPEQIAEMRRAEREVLARFGLTPQYDDTETGDTETGDTRTSDAKTMDENEAPHRKETIG